MNGVRLITLLLSMSSLAASQYRLLATDKFNHLLDQKLLPGAAQKAPNALCYESDAVRHYIDLSSSDGSTSPDLRFLLHYIFLFTDASTILVENAKCTDGVDAVKVTNLLQPENYTLGLRNTRASKTWPQLIVDLKNETQLVQKCNMGRIGQLDDAVDDEFNLLKLGLTQKITDSCKIGQVVVGFPTPSNSLPASAGLGASIILLAKALLIVSN